LQNEKGAAFDFIFLDPPYASENDCADTLRSLENSPLVSDSTMVIAEHLKNFKLPAHLARLKPFRALRQGDSALTFYRRSP